MTKRNTKRNAGTLLARHGFKICKNPTVDLADDEPQPDTGDRIGQTRSQRRPLLFAIARDPRTIFASWHIDWLSVFEKTLPADRQVHIRVIGRGGIIETTVAVEPMSDMHYVTTTGLHASYHAEIGYFQPLDHWHSVATSGEIEMPPEGCTIAANVDLATIPFHLNFQQLANLFGAADHTSIATVVSESQRRLLSDHTPNEATALDTQISRDLNVSLHDIAAAERAFKNTDTEKLARHARATFRAAVTSPQHGFQANASA